MHPQPARPARLIMAVFALLAASSLGAGEPLTMRLTPAMALEPATLVVDAVAERDPANRALQIQVESEDYYRSSLIQLDGNDAPRTTTIRYDGVPGGNYDVRVILLGAGGQQRAATARTVEVLSRFGR